MRNGHVDPEFEVLARFSGSLRSTYESSGPDPWEGSPFAWILRQPSRRKGAVGEKLVEGWLMSKGLRVTRSPDSDADRVVEGHRVEIKFSTLWNTGGYKFQQVRDQNYAYLFCLGLSPFEAHGWAIPKGTLHKHVIGVTGQHTGAGGTDTAWIGFQADDPPDWILPYGGSLDEAYEVLRSFGRGSNYQVPETHPPASGHSRP